LLQSEIKPRKGTAIHEDRSLGPLGKKPRITMLNRTVGVQGGEENKGIGEKNMGRGGRTGAGGESPGEGGGKRSKTILS